MRWTKLVKLFLYLTAIVATACTQPAAAPITNTTETSATAPSAKPNTLTAVKVDAVAADGAAAFWADAPVLTVATKGSLEGAADGPEVKVQAVYDDQAIAMRFAWTDASASVLKNGWQWDGTQFTKSGDEDRVQLLWAIQNNADFAAKGCAAACHNMDADESKWWMGTESADLSYDLWHWKAARTNQVGQSDDQWVGVLADPADVESSRYSDAKESGGYKDNVNEAGDAPAFMHGNDTAAQFILGGEEVALDTAALTSGVVIPGFVITPAVGSRGDVTANGVWQDGEWVVVLLRALDTGHEDDVTFTPPKAYPFGLGVTDDGGGTDHTVGTEVLTLEWQ